MKSVSFSETMWMSVAGVSLTVLLPTWSGVQPLIQSGQIGRWALVLSRPIGGKYEDLSFSDTRNGWVVAARGDILHTSDGGRTWTVQATGLGGLRSVVFLDQFRGFAGTLTGRLYRTLDGGSTWTDISMDLPRAAKGFCGMAHIGANVYMVGRYAGVAADYFFSADSGRTWRVSDLRVFAQGLVDVAFVTETVGFIGGIGIPQGAGRQGSPIVIKTTDGGRTWRNVFEDIDSQGYVWKLFPVSPTIIYAALQSDDGTYRIAKTADGGDHWKTLIVATGRPKGAGVQGIGFVNENVGWVGGFFHGMYVTQDGGRTWSLDSMSDAIINRYRAIGGALYTAGTRGVLRYVSPRAGDRQ